VDWDLLFVGDGSGSGWAGACGWANVLVDRLTREYTLFSGAMNCSSVNVAELMPYLHALNYFHATQGRKRLNSRAKFFKVHVITDSKFTAESGTQACDLTKHLPSVHQALWAAVREFTKFGYVFHWHWQGRSSVVFNQCCDLVASIARRSVIDTTAGKPPPVYREELLAAGRAMERLARTNKDELIQPTLEAGIHALRMLLFSELPYAEQLIAAMGNVRLRDATGKPIPLDQLDTGWQEPHGQSP
jgi:ribonuclease HI